MSASQGSTRDKTTGALYWTFLPRIVQMAITLVTSVYIVKSLGDFEYGRLKALDPILRVIIIGISFGLGQALNRFVPEIRLQNPGSEARALLYRCLGIQSLLWLATLGGIFLLRGFLYEVQHEYAPLLILGVLLSIVEIWAQSLNAYATASYKTREVAVGISAGSIFMAAATWYLLSRGLKIEGVLWSLAIGHAANVVFLTVLLRRLHEPESSLAVPQSRFPLGRLFRYALPWVPNNALHFVVWRSSETVFLTRYHEPELSAYFDRAYALPQLTMEFIPLAMHSLLLASFSESSTVSKERMPNFIAYYYRLLFFVVVPIAYGGIAIGDLLLTTLYPDLAPAGPYCRVFFFIFMLTFFGTPLSMAVYVIEKVWVNLLLNVAYGVVTIGLDLLLIPKYGLIGAIIPTAIVTALTPFVRYWIARRYVPGIRIPWGFIGRVYVAAAPVLGLLLLRPYLDGFMGLLLAALYAAVATLIGYRLFRVLGPTEREFIANSKLPGRDWVLRIL